MSLREMLVVSSGHDDEYYQSFRTYDEDAKQGDEEHFSYTKSSSTFDEIIL